jgi:hypothetical protein
MAPSPRLVAFVGELDAAMPALQARAEALILTVPGEGQPSLRADEEAVALMRAAEGIMGPVQGWVKAVQALADAERAWGPREHAARAGQAFVAQTEAFLGVWEGLLRIQPATPPMRHVLGLIHTGFYEFFVSGPTSLWRSAGAIVEGKEEAKLAFEPAAPSLNQASQELWALRRQR